MLILIFILLVFLLVNVNKEPFINIKEKDAEDLNELSKKLLESFGVEEPSDVLSTDLTESIIQGNYSIILDKVTDDVEREKINKLVIIINKELLKRLYKRLYFEQK